MFDVILYQYNGNPNVVPKQLGNGITTSGVINVLNYNAPQITFRGIGNSNYLYVPTLNRYYYINETVAKGNNTVTVQCKLDVLQTYKDSVLNATATLTESEKPNSYVSNRNIVYDSTPILDKIPFEGFNGFNSNGNIVMVTLKGNDK